ncbi:hypothetical protein CB0940_08571 [Cercospora beticola]|uniref:Uncharacterized protein n=1 Tax=Cercospora beticola TaxID=122368 RepID=A0A2G5HPS5_CERBT|nr:hypothetical protein CB0940_08571 [Cercospora beticola]PIA94544.1 hypothetical protein CB0940_08571 [Cercospora beticola]WPB05148.1 hypothetical protein RHO25_009798 [Cercospora beticola]CAK1364934.1 unnamed protein product [Cercospora beticola]
MRRLRKKYHRSHALAVKDGIPLPRHDPAIQTANEVKKAVPINRWKKYKPLVVELADPTAVVAVTRILEADIEKMRVQEEHFQPYTNYFHKKSCVLEGAEKQLAELRKMSEDKGQKHTEI